MHKAASYRTILRASSLMGAASVLHILLGIVRIKIAAVLLGPAGVGLIGILQNMMATATAVGTLGMDTVGTRKIASEPDPQQQAQVARALFWGLLGFGLIVGTGFFVLRQPISTALLGMPESESQIGWIAVGILFAVASAAQIALLNGLRRIRSLALLKVLSAILATCLCIAALLSNSTLKIQLFIIAVPFANLAVGHLLVWTIRRNLTGGRGVGVLPQIRKMAVQGAPLMLASLATILAQLAVRSLVQVNLGSAALGHFEASWMISMTYLGFVLGAMATDYFPRLSAAIADPVAASRLVNEQTEVALILIGPVLIVLMAFAPLVINLLYTAEFHEAAGILRWQIFGDLLKIISWPLSFVLLALGLSRTYLCVEAVAAAVFVAVVASLLGSVGINSTGIGFLAIYLVYAPLVLVVAYKRIGFRWSAHVMLRAGALAAGLGTVFAVTESYPRAGMVAGGMLAVIFAIEGACTIRRTTAEHRKQP